ncbi:hypothetical protein LINGRAHAP2_LOCUS7450 [Linum grandiflorum]
MYNGTFGIKTRIKEESEQFGSNLGSSLLIGA